MNSLTELNGYVNNLSFTFTDQRSANVIFDRTTPTNQSQMADEATSLTTSLGIEIVEIVNSDLTNVIYTIDVSAIVGATIAWATVPAGVTIATTAPGVYRITGITDKILWDAVKQGTLTLPANYSGLKTYTSTISYYSAIDAATLTKSWTTALTINDVEFLSSPATFNYAVNSTANITNVPLIVNVDATYPTATWTVVITPSITSSITNFTTTGTGGSFSVNPTTKVVTISGTRAQVNSRLSGLTLVSNSTVVDFTLTYNLSNNQDGNTDSKIQLINSVSLIILGAVTSPTVYFIEDSPAFSVTGAPEVSDKFYDGSGTYTYTITPSQTAAVVTMATTGTDGVSTFNNTTKVLTIIGNRSQINARLATLTLKTTVDWATDFTLSYSVTTPRLETATKIQVLACGSNDTEITNMNISRNYLSNNSNSIFASNTPTISDFDTSESTYTISFSTGIGLFGFGTEVPTSTLTFSGTRAQCNAKFATVKFYPNVGVSSNGTFTYTQLKNGQQQVNQTVALLGGVGTYSGTREVLFTNSQNWVPNPEDAYYGKIQWILLTGGGGGGGGGYFRDGPAVKYGGGGGGGASVIYSTTDIFLTAGQSYPIVIGAGGLAGINGSPSVQGTAGGPGGTTTAFGLSAGGGAGGGFAPGQGGSSGIARGSATQDDDGRPGGTAYSIEPFRAGGGGGGHISVNGGGAGANATASSGGRGGTGFDQPGAANSFWAAGGGGGGPSRGAGGSTTAGNGASDTTGNATVGSTGYGGGGGGGGWGAYLASNGTKGVVIIKLESK